MTIPRCGVVLRADPVDELQGLAAARQAQQRELAATRITSTLAGIDEWLTSR